MNSQSRTQSGLRRKRLAAGLTQRELADRAGICRTAVVELENDPNRRPRRLTAASLAAALKADPAELFPDLAGEWSR